MTRLTSWWSQTYIIFQYLKKLKNQNRTEKFNTRYLSRLNIKKNDCTHELVVADLYSFSIFEKTIKNQNGTKKSNT